LYRVNRQLFITLVLFYIFCARVVTRTLLLSQFSGYVYLFVCLSSTLVNHA